ncbi:hypothetical protein BKI52_09270 [marine bacterium AO1-C]|nr:hypothetical protein BKI52_09270 [marine bacterium AO1-C]
MKKKQFYFLLIFSASLLFTTACKKQVEPSEEPCTSNSSHLKRVQYQAVLDKYVAQGITGLSAVMITPQNGTWSGTAGLANVEDSVQMNLCHLHHTASLAKSFTGVVVLQLIEEGKISFESKIASYLSDEVQKSIPAVEKITIKHLLQHTSGIPEVFDDGFLGEVLGNPGKTFTTQELLARNQGKAGLFEPGTAHYYSDPNSMILSLIIDKIEGDHTKSFKTRIFEPLGLGDTFYHNSDYPNLTNLARSYWDFKGDGQIENITDFQKNLTSYIKGSDGIIASVQDMAKFYTAVFEGNLISKQSLEYLKTDWVKEHGLKMNTHYTHGFMVIEAEDGRWIGHTGSQLGASGYVYYNIDTQQTIALFTNTGTLIFPKEIEMIFFHLWNELRQVI